MRNQDVLLPEVVNILVIHWLPRNYGSKRTESEGVARGRSLFTYKIAKKDKNKAETAT